LGLLNDLWGKLYWKNLPYSEVTMSSGNKSYDENGYVNYAPLISGVERNRDYTQALMKKWRVEANYKMERDSLYIGVDHIYHNDLPYVAYKRHYHDGLSVQYAYDFRFGMAGADIVYQNYRLGIHTNKLIAPSALKLSFHMVHAF
jgi:hypothetical protein